MEFNIYQQEAVKTAVFKEDMGVAYYTIALNGEAGEIAEKCKKIIRDKGGNYTDEDHLAFVKELGDILWYIAKFADELGYTLDEVAKINLEKLWDRQRRGVLQGSGDNR